MYALIDASLARARTVFALLVLILVAGTISYIAIPKEAEPDVDIPIMYVVTTLDGISPEDAERLLVRPLETQLKTIEGLKEMRATAREGSASVTLEFEAGFDADQALADVREKVDLAKKDLPPDAKEPSVNEVNAGLFPILVITLSGNVAERALIQTARDLSDKLESLPSVLEAEVVGDRDDLLEIIVDPVKLEAYRISGQELLNAVTLNNRLVPAGALDTGAGRFSVKVPGLFEDVDDVLNLPIKVRDEGVVTLRDVTTIQRSFKDPTSVARLNGKPAIVLEVKKRLGENLIETVENVRKIVAEDQKNWPEGINLTFSQDKSGEIRDMLGDLQNNLVSAVLMVIVVVVAALGWRSTALVVVAIPTSFLLGILFLYGAGMTVNIVVLFSLILAAGNVVDGAIVITEYAERKMAEGMDKRQAYASASKRMAWPILASIATQACAFMPLLFWPGVVGQFMKYLPLTQVVTLTASLLVGLVFITVLGAYFGRPSRRTFAEVERERIMTTGDISTLPGIPGAYGRLLSRLVRRPFMVTMASVGMLIGVMGIYSVAGNGVIFFPDVDPEQANVYVHARGNLSMKERTALVAEAETRIAQVPGIRTVYSRISANGYQLDVAEDVIGIITLDFADWRERAKVKAILEEVRTRTKDLAGVHVETFVPKPGPPTIKAIDIQVRSDFPELLYPTVAKIRAQMDAMPGLRDVEDTRNLPGIEWQLEVDRAQAGRFGADVASVGSVIQMVTTGVKVGSYRPNDADKEVDIRVRFPIAERGILQLDELRVPTRDGLVPISNFVTRTAEPKVGVIKRAEGSRVVNVRANVDENYLINGQPALPNDMVNVIRPWIEGQNFDERLTITFKGEDEDQREAGAFLVKAFGMAVFLMAIILVTQFNSFYRAFLILTAVVFSTIGVMLGIMITGQTFSVVMTGIGIIALAGIVVNNNIILIDTYAELRDGGMEPEEAAVRTGAQRLLPVFLTAIVNVLSLLPLVFGVNIDFIKREVTMGAPSSEWWVQLSTAVAFGLSFATVLTLIVTPSMLVLGERFGATLKGLRPRWGKRGLKPLQIKRGAAE